MSSLVAVRYLNEPCGENDTCADSLVCLNGTCRCPHAHSNRRLSDDRHRQHQQPCLQSNYKFLGSPCKHSDVCYHEACECVLAVGSSAPLLECSCFTSHFRECVCVCVCVCVSMCPESNFPMK